MKKRSDFDVFCSNVSLICRERGSASRQLFKNTWMLWLARAKAWEAWREHDVLQQDMRPNEYLDASEPLDYEILLRSLESARIQRSADRLGVHIPDALYECLALGIDGSRRHCLTDEGLADVLPKIRRSSRERRQEIGYWVGLAIGLVGALTGFVAVL